MTGGLLAALAARPAANRADACLVRMSAAGAARLRNALSRRSPALGDLPIGDLRARWRTVFRKVPPPTLSRNLLFRTLAYRLQADRFGDLDARTRAGGS